VDSAGFQNENGQSTQDLQEFLVIAQAVTSLTDALEDLPREKRFKAVHIALTLLGDDPKLLARFRPYGTEKRRRKAVKENGV